MRVNASNIIALKFANLAREKKINRIALVTFVLLTLVAADFGLFAAVPQLINAQGKLTNGQGTPISDGNYSITFTIYDAASGGAAKWTETNPTVAVANGQFNVLLGSISSIDDSVFSGTERYLGIKVGSDPEMTPRSRLVSVGYAQRAGTVDGGTIRGERLKVASDTGATVLRVGNDATGNTSLSLSISQHSNGFADIQCVQAEGSQWGQLRLNKSGGEVTIGGQLTTNTIFRVLNGNMRLQNQNPRFYLSDNLGTGYIGTDNNKTFLFAPDEQVKVKLNTNQMALNNCNLAVQNVNPRIFLLDLAGTGFIGTDNNMNFVFAPGQTERLRLSTDGHMTVSGTTTTCVLEITGGCDLAEPFEIGNSSDIPAGSVVVIDPSSPGRLMLSDCSYDKRVAGIVSGAGGVKPGMTMQQDGVMEGGINVALTGRVYALATSANGTIEPGDLLTTSNLAGHLMKATDESRCHGTVVGKAMSRLESGEGLVLVLVNLQ